MVSKASLPTMPRPSKFEQFLKQFPDAQRRDIESEVLRCRDSKAAHEFLKNQFKYKFSYDSIKHWRGLRSKGLEGLSQQSSEVARKAATLPQEVDPVSCTMGLALRLNNLCNRLVDVLEAHDWIEPGEARLSPRQAVQLATSLPSLVRASSNVILELHKVKSDMDRRAFALAVLEEFKQDCHRVLQHENEELIPLIENIGAVTKSRLELDTPSLLEEQMAE